MSEEAGVEAGEGPVPLDPGFGARFARERRPACQLYVCSPADIGPDFADRLRAALDGGPVAAFQLRLKEVTDDHIRRTAAALMPVCADRDVAFILNDRMDLAKELGTDGVHLGQSDGSVGAARALLGPDVQIGVTCHDSRHLAMEAGEAGADYVAFGAFYETTTKPSHYRPTPDAADVVDDAVAAALRRHRRHHARQRAAADRRRRRLHLLCQRGVEAPRRTGGGGGGLRGGVGMTPGLR